MSEVYQVTHLDPVSTITISLSRFESTAIGNSVDVSDGSENLPSKDLAALSVPILLDDPSVASVDMVMVKRDVHCISGQWACVDSSHGSHGSN